MIPKTCLRALPFSFTCTLSAQEFCSFYHRYLARVERVMAMFWTNAARKKQTYLKFLYHNMEQAIFFCSFVLLLT